ncbi:MAG: tetratricopeptide repeat protein [Myxococcota bacterium]|nr:tetratricopeptide repeat protein [Myxococcota bacterium]
MMTIRATTTASLCAALLAGCGARAVPSQAPPPSMADAVALVEREDYAAAEPILEALLRERLAPPAEAHHYLGVCAQARGDFANAESHYREALRRQPALFESRLNLGGVLGTLGRHAEALEMLRGLADAFPDEPQAHLALAFQQQTMGDLDAALASCRRAAGIDPTDVDAALMEADILELQGRHDDRPAALEAALRRTAGDPRIAVTMADAYAGLGRPHEAIVMYVFATAAPGADATMLGGIALELRDLGAVDEALDAAAAGVERSADGPEHVRAVLTLARIARGAGRADAAETALRSGLRRRPGDRVLSLYLGGILAEAGRCDEAAPLLRAARSAFAEDDPAGRHAAEAAAALVSCGAE